MNWVPGDTVCHSSFGEAIVLSAKYLDSRCILLRVLFTEDNWETTFEEEELVQFEK